MKPTFWSCVVFGAAVALSAGVAAGGVGDLTYAKATPPGISGGGVNIAMKTPANPKAVGLTHPKAMVTADGALVKVAFDSDDANADALDVARIVMSGKSDFTKAVTVKLVKTRRVSANYTMLALPPHPIEIRKDGKRIPALLSGRYYRMRSRTSSKPGAKLVMRVSGNVSVQVVGQGKCQFGDTVRKVLVIDSNRNMTLGDVTTLKRGDREYKQADYCRIADAKGKFVTSSRTGYAQMGQPTQIDGKWYSLTCDNMKISAKPLSDSVGTLSIDAPRWECMLTGNGLTLNVVGGVKPVEVPAGEYRVRMFRLYQEADTTKPCANIYGSQNKPLTITAGKATTLAAGADITATMSAKASKGKVRFSISQTDAAGSRISGIYGAGGRRPQAPQIEVVNKAGKVVYTAKLAYG